jgi:hypothetical protein
MFQLNAKQTARKLLEHRACYFNAVFFAQSNSFLSNISQRQEQAGLANRPALLTN